MEDKEKQSKPKDIESIDYASQPTNFSICEGTNTKESQEFPAESTENMEAKPLLDKIESKVIPESIKSNAIAEEEKKINNKLESTIKSNEEQNKNKLSQQNLSKDNFENKFHDLQTGTLKNNSINVNENIESIKNNVHTKILDKYIESIADFKCIYHQPNSKSNTEKKVYEIPLKDEKKLILKSIFLNSETSNYLLEKISREYYIGKTLGEISKNIAKTLDMQKITTKKKSNNY